MQISNKQKMGIKRNLTNNQITSKCIEMNISTAIDID